jgi:hypothetical protein
MDDLQITLGKKELACWTTQVSLEIIPLINNPYLFGMLRIIQAQTPDGLDILWSQGGKQETDIRDLVCDFMLPKNLALDDAGLLGL